MPHTSYILSVRQPLPDQDCVSASGMFVGTWREGGRSGVPSLTARVGHPGALMVLEYSSDDMTHLAQNLYDVPCPTGQSTSSSAWRLGLHLPLAPIRLHCCFYTRCETSLPLGHSLSAPSILHIPPLLVLPPPSWP